MKITRLLRELIAIPSINPTLAPPNDARAGEQRLAEFLDDRARRAGFEREWQEVKPGRSNLLIRWRSPGKMKRRILLAPHLDTVGAPGLGPELFDPVEKGGRIHGRGACDTKGSIAAMFWALEQLGAGRQRPAQTEVCLALLVDEESGQAGSRAFVAAGLKASLAIVGEPTELAVASAHKGAVWLRLRTRGKAAHGARPELGRNAVHRMARAVDLLESQYARLLRQKSHPLLGRPTINVGSIQGGTQPNIVPADCEATIDRRTLPGETDQSVRQELRRLFSGRDLDIHFFPLQAAPCLSMETDFGLDLVQQFLRAARRKRPLGVDYFSDASVLSHGGIPSILYGPGSIAQAHTSDEWISVRQLEAAGQVLTRFLRSLA